MGLRLTLKPGERVILNGCIVRNAGRGRMDLEVENRSDVLRAEEIITQSEARLPVRSVAHAIQHALASRETRDQLVPHILTSLDRIEAALDPVVAPVLRAVRESLGTGDFYAALRKLGPVLDREKRLLGDGLPRPS
jgi:flagellar biosynthesis repressor protein FlbT